MYPQGQNGQNFNVAPQQASAPQFNVAPDLGNVAANLGPGSLNMPNPNMPNVAPTVPEVAPMQSQEMLSNPETQTGPGQSQTPQDDQAAMVQQPVAMPVAAPTLGGQSVVSSAPADAADEDLIEKEWVDQAKNLVAQTRDNPHEQSRLAAELMRDYVKKRYGKIIGKAEE